MTKAKKTLSTFEREMKNAKFKKAFDKSYKEFLLSELLIAIMENDEISVRDLAKEAGLSPTIIQKIRSGKQDDLKISNFCLDDKCSCQGTKLFSKKIMSELKLKIKRIAKSII